MNLTEKEMAAVFEEWNTRYKNNPKVFADNGTGIGSQQVKYFTEIYNELFVEGEQADITIPLTIKEANFLVETLDNHCDEGPWGQGYQSNELSSISGKIDDIVNEQKEAIKKKSTYQTTISTNSSHPK